MWLIFLSLSVNAVKINQTIEFFSHFTVSQFVRRIDAQLETNHPPKHGTVFLDD